MEEKIEMLRRTLDEVVPRCSAAEELGNALHMRGISFVRFVDDPDPAVTARGWERPVSFSELGDDYRIEVLRARIDAAWAAYTAEQEAHRSVRSLNDLRETRQAQQAVHKEGSIRNAIEHGRD